MVGKSLNPLQGSEDLDLPHRAQGRGQHLGPLAGEGNRVQDQSLKGGNQGLNLVPGPSAQSLNPPKENDLSLDHQYEKGGLNHVLLLEGRGQRV